MTPVEVDDMPVEAMLDQGKLVTVKREKTAAEIDEGRMDVDGFLELTGELA